MSYLARVMVAAIALAVIAAARPAAADSRIALVIGNGGYAREPIANALADAGLVAEALTTIGFDVVEGADLDQADLRRTFREFLSRVEAVGPDAIAFVYFSGYALEFEGENYLVPIDARLARDGDIPLEDVRVSDLMHALAALSVRAKILTLDATRPLPFTLPVAPGLAPMEAPPGMLVAFSSAPGTFAEDSGAPYGAYASAIAEMLREPLVDLATTFGRIRVRTHALTEGRQTPWHVASLTSSVVLVPDDGSDRPPAVAAAPAGDFAPPVAAADLRPIRGMDPEQAYGVAIERDTLPGYVEYLDAYPDSVYAPQIWVIVRTRREALTWFRACKLDFREAYWTYLHHYPDGMYAADARRRLRRLAALAEPPPGFAPIAFAGLPPPLAREPRKVAMVPPQAPPPRNLIAPRPAYFANLPPPLPPAGPRLLPPAIGMPVVPRLGQPAKRFAPPVRVVVPGSEKYPQGPAGAPAGPGGGQPQAIQPAPYGAPAGTPPPGVVARPGLPAGSRPGGVASPPLGAPGAAAPAPGVRHYPGGVPVTPPAVRVVPAPPPAVVARPVPPVVHPPPAIVRPNPPAVQGRGAPAGRKCAIVNGVERCF
jgi:hypothetical protein